VNLSGPLQDIQLPAMLQTLAVNGSTGRLTFTQRDGQAVLVLREGRIIYAATNSARETFGSILLHRGLITEADLAEALERQHAGPEPRRLGRMLIEMGRIEERVLRGVMRQQTEEVISELQRWKTGFFRFEPLPISPEGEVEVDVKDFLVADGFQPQEVVLKVLGSRGGESKAAMPPPSSFTPPKGMRAVSLGMVVGDAAIPAFTAETTLRLMRQAAQVLKRGVLFLVRPDEVRGMGQFGMSLPERFAAQVVRDTAIPLHERSVFRDVVEGRLTWRGALEPTPWNRHLLDRLGGLTPAEAVVMPMVVGGVARVVFYGDNLPEPRKVGPLDALEYVVTETARAMERATVEIREKGLEGKRPRA
jgi:hypothetical protein